MLNNAGLLNILFRKFAINFISFAHVKLKIQELQFQRLDPSPVGKNKVNITLICSTLNATRVKTFAERDPGMSSNYAQNYFGTIE